MIVSNQLLIAYLKELHVPTIRECFEDIARTAEQESLSYERYLLELAERECEARRERRIGRLLRESRLPLEKNIDSFDLKRLPAKVRQQVTTLLDSTFIDRKENVLAFGNPGTGKSEFPTSARAGVGDAAIAGLARPLSGI